MKINILKKAWSVPLLRKCAFGLLLSLPVIVYTFKFSILNRHGIFAGEDWDYFAQSYEAARLSILKYHQFPWWNPWVNGGQPLFANPQFGLFSIQMPLVLLFGTIPGLHYAIMVYYLLGFWGMYLLLQRVGSTSKLITTFLSYIWVFSGFNVWHTGGGQLTFAIYLLAPWAFLTLLNIHKKHGWIWFGLVISLFLQTSPHYITIEVVILCALVAAAKLGRQYYRSPKHSVQELLPALKPYALSLLLITVLGCARLFYTFQFLHQYPRPTPLDPPIGLKLFLASITFRHPIDPAILNGTYGWTEYGNYFGLATLALFAYFLIRKFENIKRILYQEWLIILLIVISILISLGSFSRFSPFSTLHHLPVFSQMRVPSRFICWVAFGIILFLARLPRKPVVYLLLIISAIDVFAATYPALSYYQRPYSQMTTSRQFEQHEFYQVDPSLGQAAVFNTQNLRLLRATQQNIGEVYGYEPILNIGEYYFLPGTNRCGTEKGCQFVLSNNAVLTMWSPNKIKLKRTSPGPIKLNMNPGKVWKVNNKAVFSNDRVLELQKDFVITDPSQDIQVTYTPAL